MLNKRSLAQPSPVFSLKIVISYKTWKRVKSVPVAVFLLLTLQIGFCFQESHYILISVSGKSSVLYCLCIVCVQIAAGTIARVLVCTLRASPA